MLNKIRSIFKRPAETPIVRLSASDYTSLLTRAAFNAATDEGGVSGAHQTVASFYQRGFWNAVITGADAGKFPPDVIGIIAERLCLYGESCVAIATPAIPILRFACWGAGQNDYGVTYVDGNGNEVSTRHAIHFKFSEDEYTDYRGLSPLDRAVGLRLFAQAIEQSLAFESSTLTKTALMVPELEREPIVDTNGDPVLDDDGQPTYIDTSDLLKQELAGDQGGTMFVENLIDDEEPGKAARLPYEMIHFQPAVTAANLSAYTEATKAVYRAFGLPDNMIGDKEGMRQAGAIALQGMARLVESACRRKALDIRINLDAMDYEALNSKTRAAKQLSEADIDFTADQIKEKTGLA